MRILKNDPTDTTLFIDSDAWSLDIVVSEWDFRDDRRRTQYVTLYHDQVEYLKKKIAEFEEKVKKADEERAKRKARGNLNTLDKLMEDDDE